LYFGLALRGPLRPIGEPGRFHAALRGFRRAMIRFLKLFKGKLELTHRSRLGFTAGRFIAAARGD
jgi:hypothetical protein